MRYRITIVPLLCVFVCACAARRDTELAAAPLARLPRSTGTCLFIRTVSDWKPVDDYGLILRTSPRKGYLVKLSTKCPGLRGPSTMLGFESVDGLVCDYRMDAILAGSQRCPIGSIEPYTAP